MASLQKICAPGPQGPTKSPGENPWILPHFQRGKIQKIPIGVYPVYLMSTKNNLGTCCGTAGVKRFPLHVERVNVYPDEKFCILQKPESRSWSGFRAFLADFVRGAMRL